MGSAMCGSGVSGLCPAGDASSRLSRSLAAWAPAEAGSALGAAWAACPAAALAGSAGLAGASATAWKAFSSPDPCGEPPPPLADA